MLFSKRLKQKAKPILHEIFDHPFVKGIASGTLPKEAITFYVQQDFQYLNAFVKLYAYAIIKSETREDMDFFKEQIDYTLHSENMAHENLCQVANLSYDTLKEGKIAPVTLLYQEHMLDQGVNGSLLDILACLIPCPWTYWEIGKRLVEQHPSLENHPFKDWITFYGTYGNGEMAFAEELFRRLNEKAGKASTKALDQAEHVFLRSCELEWMFWEMAYYRQHWTFNDRIKI